MHVIIVGSGDAFGSGGRFQTCIALADHAGAAPHTLIDCGSTSLTPLRQQEIDPAAISTVVVTHLHGDHFGGLPFLILDGQFRGRTRDLTVVGPPGTSERLTAAMEALFPGSARVRRRFGVRVLDHAHARSAHVDGLTVTPYEVRHASGAPAYAVRVESPVGSLAYSGDTEWTDALIDASDGAGLFLCEGYSPQPIRWHLDLDTLDRNRHRLGAGELMLTHLSPAALAADLTGWHTARDGLRRNVG